MKKIKNWKKFNESLILERSTLSQYFSKEDVSKLHKENDIPHDVPVEEIPKAKLKKVLLGSDRLDYRSKSFIVKLKDGSIGILNSYRKNDLQTVIDNMDNIEKVLVYDNKNSYGSSEFKTFFDKKRSRSVWKKLDDYYQKYMEGFFKKMTDYLIEQGARLGMDYNDGFMDLDPLWLEDELKSFKYMKELLDFVNKVNMKRYSDMIMENIMNDYEDHIRETYGEDYNKSYDEFKHDFSLFIVYNKDRYFDYETKRDSNYDPSVDYSDLSRESYFNNAPHKFQIKYLINAFNLDEKEAYEICPNGGCEVGDLPDELKENFN